MHEQLLAMLADPTNHQNLIAEPSFGPDQTVIEGSLISQAGRYPIRNGIPRFVLTQDVDQRQTEAAFSYKWQRRDSYDSQQVSDSHRAWLVEKYGFVSFEAMQIHFGTKETILDAGCGSAFSSSIWLNEDWQKNGHGQWVGVDISEAIDVAQERVGHFPGTHFVQGDILQPPFKTESFDLIFSEGVLHHTPSTRLALLALIPLLKPGGEMMFYVYRKKGPIREFTDDYIREIVSQLPEEQAWELMRPLTKLGQSLAELKVEVEIPQDIPYLGIKAGKIDIQRFFYWHVAKMFWNEDFSFEENLHVNYDWYQPRYAHRQTEAEVRAWCDEGGLKIHHFHEQESGYSVRAIKD